MVRFWETWRSDFRTPTPFVVWAVLTVIVGLAGPFGTYELYAPVERLMFWAVILAVVIIYGSAVRAFVHGTLGFADFLVGSPMIATILAGTLPPVALLMMPVLTGPNLLPLPGLFELTVFVYCTSLGVGAYRHSTGHIPFRPSTSPVPLADPLQPPLVAQPRLIRRLPETVQGPLIAIKVRDHYIDVITERGSASLLMRLSDASEETDGVDGARVHRSYWIAWPAVKGLERVDGKFRLVMIDGSRVPVSRTYRDAVEERGIGIARAD
ncbi:MAG: LytTR family DNA-binding domain-containing protein [Paracoccaceae bacterium]